jgi:tripartite motif-containing protein 71
MKSTVFFVVAAVVVAVTPALADWVYEGRWGSVGFGNGQFNLPEDVALAANGTVYVADRENYRVQYFTPAGSFLGKWGYRGSGDGQFSDPSGVSYGPGDVVYVADRKNHRVQYFTPSGSFLGVHGSEGTGNGQFQGPYGIAFAPNGARAYVADYNNHRVQYFRESPPAVIPSSVGRIKALFK